jgi:hypothetical protein
MAYTHTHTHTHVHIYIYDSDRVYFCIVNLGQICGGHWGMDFLICGPGVNKISFMGAAGLYLENKAITCLSLVPV